MVVAGSAEDVLDVVLVFVGDDGAADDELDDIIGCNRCACVRSGCGDGLLPLSLLSTIQAAEKAECDPPITTTLASGGALQQLLLPPGGE